MDLNATMCHEDVSKANMEIPRRRVFSLHLSTALMIMIVADGLLWVNVLERRLPTQPSSWPWAYFDSTYKIGSGFPCLASIQTFRYRSSWLGENQLPEAVGKKEWRVSGIIINLLFALFTLVVTWVSCERIARLDAKCNLFQFALTIVFLILVSWLPILLGHKLL